MLSLLRLSCQAVDKLVTWGGSVKITEGPTDPLALDSFNKIV